MKTISRYFRPIILGITLAVLLVFVLQFSGFFNIPVNQDTQNPYEYNLDDLKNIKPELLKWNESFTVPIHIKYPKAIAIDKYDKIYICGEKQVVIYDSNMDIAKNFEIPIAGRSIFVDHEQKIYLGMQGQLHIFSDSGSLISKFNQLSNKTVITSIAANENFIFVADAGKRIVWKLDLSGKVISQIGEKDPSRDIPGFIIPSPYFDLGFDNVGQLWVVNPGRHFLENYSFNGDLKTHWGKTSNQVHGFCGCCNPSHFAILSNGSFITSEKGLERVKEYSVTGQLMSVVAGPYSFDEGTVGLGLAVDSHDRVFVLDPSRKQIRIFVRKN